MIHWAYDYYSDVDNMRLEPRLDGQTDVRIHIDLAPLVDA
jgi:hypothetical protein